MRASWWFALAICALLPNQQNSYRTRTFRPRYSLTSQCVDVLAEVSGHGDGGSLSISSSSISRVEDATATVADRAYKLREGRPHTTTSRAKISAANTGKVPWNVGKQHSEETKKRIAEKTKEAMLKRKLAKLQELGLTVEEYEQQRKSKKRADRLSKSTGLTEEGRRKISESAKKRWQNPEYRRQYTEVNKGSRNHSESTRARISAAIKAKWKEPEYRERVKVQPSEEVRARISATLKARWEDPVFRERMLNHSFARSNEWRELVSQKIRKKWQDPTYRTAVEEGIRASNRTMSLSGSGENMRGGEGGAVSRRQKAQANGIATARDPSRKRSSSVEEARERKRETRKVAQKKEQARAEVFKAAKKATATTTSNGQSRSLKELLGGELWFEEKMRRRKIGSPILDDETLEKQLADEWRKDDTSSDDDYDEEDDEGDEYFDDDDDLNWPPRTSDSSADVIEVYDEEGNLVGTYTDEEFELLKKSGHR